jgi:hypothetical protein
MRRLMTKSSPSTLAAAALVCVLLGPCAQARAQGSDAAASAIEACVAQHVEAQRARLRGDLLIAREQLLLCAQSGCPALVSNDCTAWLAEVEASLPTIVLAVRGADGRDLSEVRVSVNGRALTQRLDGKAIAIDPGSYELSFEAAGHAPLNTQLTVHQAEKNRIVRVQLARSADAREEQAGIPMLSYVLGGVAIAGLGTFAYFGLRGTSEHSDAKESCAPDCPQSKVDDIERAYAIADVGLGVGIASAAAAVIVYFVAQPSERAEHTAQLNVIPSRDGASMLWSARF